MSHGTPQPIPIESKEAGHELRDAPTFPIWIAFVSVFALLFGSIVAVIVLLGYLETDLEKRNQAYLAIPKIEQAQTIPSIRLQANPERDWQVYETQEEHLLTTYGWVDKGTGQVRVPIEVAIDMAIEQDVFPVR